MKIIFSLFFLAICSKDCNWGLSQTSIQELDYMTITYEASTRGFYEKTWVTKDSVSFSADRSLNEVIVSKCQSADWNALIGLVKNINLKDLPELEAPTQMHQVDGAAMATLTIKLNKETYQTNIFDHGHPPKAISGLVNKVLSIQKMMPKQ